MKKTLLSFICIFSLLALTGCGSKKVTCTLLDEEIAIGYKIKSEAIATVKDGNIKEYDLNITMTFEDEDLATSSYDILVNDHTNKDMKFKRKGKEITGSTTENLSEAVSKSEFISGLEGEGYTCK